MNSKNKTKAFVLENLGVVALITATTFAMLFAGCQNNAGGNNPNPTPKHKITFGVEGTIPNGTLTAKSEGIDETTTSPISVEEGKSVTFTAMPATAKHRVKEWKVGGTVVENHKENTYTYTVAKKDATITVSFEKMPPVMHEVTFSVEGTPANGTLKAMVEGSSETSESPISVEEGKSVTFTAMPSEGYWVKEWKVGNKVVPNETKNTYKHTVTGTCKVTVSFEHEGAILTLGQSGSQIHVKAKTKDDKPIMVTGCNETELKSDVGTTLTATGSVVILKGNIIELQCLGQGLVACNVQGCTSLQKLECYQNQLTELNVQGLTSLQVLKCGTNPEITALNVQGLTALQVLECNGNGLTALDVQGLTALQKLDCSSNQLTALDAHGLVALQVLTCSGNELASLNVQECTALKEVVCYSNKLDGDAFKKFFTDLPTREANDNAVAKLYNEIPAFNDRNHKDFNTPSELKTAFEAAKTEKHWKLQKQNASGSLVDL
ncbi:MAG: leucine-rich repeat domain-containing protein [Treponema sp.]